VKAAHVLLGWGGVAAIALATRWLCDRGVERLGGSETGADEAHLAAQTCEEAKLELSIGADPVELAGTLRARVAAGSKLRSVALVVGEGVVVDRVRLGGREASASELLSGLIARPRPLATYRVDAAVDSPAELEVRFRAALDGAHLPAFVEPTRLVRVAEPARLDAVTVEIPAGGALVVGGMKEAAAAAKGRERAGGERLSRLAEGRHAVGPFDDAREPLLFGHADVRDGADWLSSQQLVAARGTLPSPATEAVARAIVERGVGERSLPPRTVAFLAGDAARGFARRAPSWCAAPPPRDAPELALALLEASAPPAPPHDELARALAPALAVFGLAPDAAASLLDAAPATVPPVERAGLRAWLALDFAFGSRARQAARDWWHALQAGPAERPPFLAEPSCAAVIAWAIAGCDVRFDRLALDSRGSRSEVRGELLVDPPPPAGARFAATLLFVGAEGVQVHLLPIAGARTPLPALALRETPLLIGVDPGHRLPRRPGAEVVFPLHYMKSTFAIASDASALAVVATRATADDGGDAGSGVLVMEAGPDARLSGRSWTPTARPIAGLEWIVPRRYLALDERGGGRALLDLADGSVERLSERILVAPRGGAFIREVERAQGCFAQIVHDLRSGLERPLPSPHHAPVAWVRGADEVVTQAADGRAAVLDLRGRERFQLPWLAASVRDVRRFDSIGYALVTEAVDGSRIALRRQDGSPIEELEVPGRLRGWSFFEATSFFYLVAEAGPRLHVVARARFGGGRAIELYRGADRPLGDTLTPKGVVLVDAESDSAPPGDPRRLLFLPFDAEGEAERSARQVCAEAFLDPPPVLASAGRYLYYLRAEGGSHALPGEQRPRALQRYDFLTGREESLEGL
jgi:hypothetical protein